jgi:glucose/arabinose dehydrogenase
MFDGRPRYRGSGFRRSKKGATARRRLSFEFLEDRYLLNGVPLAIGGDLRVHAEDFRITVFATGLNYPYSMQQLADGSLLVGISRPNGGNFFNSVGELLRLVDEDGDGVADGPGTILYTGLPGAVTSVRQAGSLFFVTSVPTGGEAISVLRAGATPADPLSFVGSIQFAFPPVWEHVSYASTVRENADQPGDFDLFFNVGSRENFAPTTDQVPVRGLMSGLLNGDAIYKVTVHDTGDTPIFYGLQQIATGLRNAAGITVQPGTGDLYFEDNGIDGLVDADEPTSADEINKIAAADIGRDVYNFGFPNDYVEYRTRRRIGSGGIQPLVAFQPYPDPLNGSESEGPAEIGFAPPGFPPGLNEGIFVGFHGRYNLGGLLNEENPVVYFEPSTGQYFHFIENGQPGIGHLDTMLTTSDSLFLADVSSTGSMFNGARGGVIYQIKAIGPGNSPAAKRPTPAEEADLVLMKRSVFLAPPRAAADFTPKRQEVNVPVFEPTGLSAATQDACPERAQAASAANFVKRVSARAIIDVLFADNRQDLFERDVPFA